MHAAPTAGSAATQRSFIVFYMQFGFTDIYPPDTCFPLSSQQLRSSELTPVKAPLAVTVLGLSLQGSLGAGGTFFGMISRASFVLCRQE